MARIQSLLSRRIVNICLLFTLTCSNYLYSQSGLQFTPEEIKIWKERAGLSSGSRMYKSTGDVSKNSPGDWDRIYADALTAVANPANDRFDNYDTSRGLNSPITELNSPWLPNQSWPARVPYIDDKEPRPGINSSDFSAMSIMNAGFVYLLTNDEKFAKPVKDELLWYANNAWLDFTNTNRWVRGSGSFADRNPGFFIACWLNTILNAYDYTKHSSIYSAQEKAVIEKWFSNAMEFFRYNLESDMSGVFNGYSNYNYSNPCTGGWCDSQRGKPFEQSSYVGYGFNEYFANRRCVIVRYIMRASLLLLDSYPSLAEKGVESAHRWIKEWIVYGNFTDGTYTDFHRGGGSNPEQGLQYTTIGLGGIIDAADAYERVYSNRSNFSSLYDWELVKGTSEYNKFFPSNVKSRPWFKHLDVNQPKGLKLIISTTLKHFDGSFGNSRSWSGQVIDGYEPNTSHYIKYVESERVVAVANLYYQDANFKSIYTRTKSGTRGYTSNPSRLGSYDINFGTWGGYPGILLMHGQLEGVVYPYNGVASKPDNNTDEEVDDEVVVTDPEETEEGITITSIEAENNGFQILSDVGSNSVVQSSTSTSNSLSLEKALKLYDKGDKVRYSFDIAETGIYQIKVRLRSGNIVNKTSYWPNGYAFQLDGTSLSMTGDESSVSAQDYNFGVSYWGTMESSNLTLTKGSHTLDIEALINWSLVDYIEIVSFNGDNGDENTDNGTTGNADLSNYNFKYQVSTWLNDKTAAVSLTFDDSYATQFTLAQAKMDERDIDGTFFVTTDFVNAALWEQIRGAYGQGHEIAGHTLSHPDLTDLSTDLITKELADSKSLIEKNVPGNEVLTVAWPYGAENANVRNIASSLNYIGGRIAGGNQTPYNPLGEDGFFYRIRTYVIYDYTTAADFESSLNGVISNKGWMTYLYHGIEGQGWKPLPISVFEAQMDILKNKEANTWTAPFKDVLRYYQERIGASLSMVSVDQSKLIVNLTDKEDDNETYNFPLTLKVTVPTNFEVKSIVQNGKEYEFTQINNLVIFNAIPDGGNISLNSESAGKGDETQTKILTTEENIDFGNVVLDKNLVKTISIKNTGNATLKIASISSNSDLFQVNYSGEIASGESSNINVTFKGSKLGEQTGELTINSDKTEGNNVIKVAAKVISDSNTFSFKIEAEDSFTVEKETGDKGTISESEEQSSILSGERAVQIYDIGDVVGIPFNVPNDGVYTVKVRLRSGDRVDPDKFFASGYTFKINGATINFAGEEESISAQDESFGVSYWGTMAADDIELPKGENLLTIEANMYWAAIDYIEVIGEGSVVSSLEVPELVEFGEVEIGKIVSKSISIKNTGYDAIKIIKIEASKNFISSWEGEIASGESKEITIEFSPENEKDYSESLVIYTEDDNAYSVNLKGTGIKRTAFSLFIEAEDHYEIVADKGNKSAIGVTAEESTILSNNKGVTLYDNGDKIRIPFTLTKAANCIIKVHLRAGNVFNPTVYLPDGYKFTVDGDLEDFKVITESISDIDPSFGQSTWGDVESSLLPFEAGDHMLEIESTLSWAVVDYVEIIEILDDSQKVTDGSSGFGGNADENEITINNFEVYPNPVQDYLNVKMDISGEVTINVVTIMDTFGKTILEKELTSYETDLLVDLRSLNTGLYLVVLKANDKKEVKRILVR